MKSLAVTAALALALAAPALAQTDHAQTDHANCPMAGKSEKKAAPAAEKSPYLDRAPLPVKALTADQIRQYREGMGMGMAIPAELNGYPGPRHVIDMAGEIELTAEQKAQMEDLFESMRVEAVRLGEEIVDLETRLDRAFSSGSMTRDELARLTGEIAVRQGKLRYTHLRAHIAAKEILTPAQVEAYNRARGY